MDFSHEADASRAGIARQRRAVASGKAVGLKPGRPALQYPLPTSATARK